MKYLDLTGLAYFWSKIKALLSNKQDVLSFDNIPTSGSTNPVTSGGIHSYYNNKEKVIAAALNDLEARKLNISDIGTDEVPTEDSTNFVTSGGLYNVITENEEIVASAINDLNDKKANISSLSPVATSGSYNDLTDKPVIPNATVDSELDSDSENPVQNKVIDEALTEIKTDYAKLANVLIPNFDGMTPIKTIELDKAAANYSQLFTRKNTGISTTMSEVQDVVLMRITVTGTNIYSRSDVIIKFQPGLTNPHAYAFHHTYSSTAATTGIMYLRFNYPKALNNDIPWMVDFYQYNATSRHYKIEVFATTENITWEETLTSTTYNSTNYNTAQITLYTSRGLCWLGTLLGNTSTANAASYISSYLPKFVNASVIKAGEALVAYNIAFFNKGFAYKISNKDVAIDIDYGVCSIGTTYALNAVIGYAYLRSIWSFTFTSPANHGLTYDTFAQGDRVYLRCTMKNGKIYSDAHLAKEMAPGYTWYLLGTAYNTTNGLAMNTTGSMFITLDDGGLITHINGKATQAALMVDGIDQENTFLKRSTPDSSVEVKNIGGNSVVWNQMMPNTGSSSPYTGVQGVTLGRKDGNVLYISGNATSAAELTFPTSGNITTIVGHVYLIHLDKEMPTGWYTGLSGSSVGTTTYGKSHITTCTSSNSYGVYICRTKNTPTGVNIDWEAHVSVFDLTQMFGAGNEPDTLEEFERMFPEPYYEYDEGTLLNLEMTGIKTEDSSSTQVSNVNFNVKTLQGIPSGGNAAETIFPYGMCGIGGVRDEIDFEAGKAVKRFGVVDLGTLTYGLDSFGFSTQQITDSKPYSTSTPISNLHILVNGYTKVTNFSATVVDKSVTLNSSYHAANKLFLRNNTYSTPADFKAAMSGVMLVYELADPVEYTITTNISTYNIVKGGCEKILPYDDNDVLTAPATMFAYYKSSFQEKLVSGENIKTINNQSLLGTGNITIQGGGGSETVYIQLGDNNGEFYLINETYSEVLALVQAGEDVVLEYVHGINNAFKDYFYLARNFNNGQSLEFVSEKIGGIELFSNNTIEGAYIYRGIETIELNGNTYTSDEGLVDLGTISGGDTNVIETVKVNGTALTPDANKAVNITVPAAPGTLNTTATTAQSTSSSEALSGNITLHKVAKTGTYNDLIGKPTIPSEVTESTVSGWGFTKNTGTYSKPSGGIPPTDLSSAVQTSLGKADTALQSYTETDPVFSASAAAGISSTDISNWNSKTSNVGTITGITMNGASKGTSGVVDLGTVITAHQSLSGKQDVINDLATIRSNASSGAAAATTIAGYGDIVTHNASEFQTKITVSSSNPSGGNNGDIWIVV